MLLETSVSGTSVDQSLLELSLRFDGTTKEKAWGRDPNIPTRNRSIKVHSVSRNASNLRPALVFGFGTWSIAKGIVPLKKEATVFVFCHF